MKLNRTEKFIKQKMQSYEADVDSAKLMDALADHLPSKRKRSFPLWIFLFVSLMILGAGSIYYKDIFGGEEKLKETISAGIPNTHINEPETLISSDFNSNQTGKVRISDSPQAKIKKESQISEPEKTISTSLNTTIKADIDFTIAENTNSVSIANTSQTLKEAGIVDNTKGIQLELKSINLIERHIYTIRQNLNKDTFEIKTVPLLKPVLCGRKAYAVYFGMGTGRSKLNFGTYDGESQPFSEYVNSISDSKNSFTFKIGANVYLSKRLYLNTGLELNQLITRFHPDWEKTEEETNTSANGGNQKISRKTTYEAIGHNYHYLFDLPLGLGLELYRSRNFILTIQSSVAFNFYRESHGYRINSDQKLVAYNGTDNDPYKSPVGFSFSSSIPLYYTINDRWQLMIKPEYINRKIEFDQSILKLNERYHTFFLSIGAKYEF